MLLEVTFGVLVLLGFLILRRCRNARRDRLPPGPPADPIIGHLRSFPATEPGKTFYRWSKEYGKSHSSRWFSVRQLNPSKATLYTSTSLESLSLFSTARKLPATCSRSAVQYTVTARSSLHSICLSIFSARAADVC